MEYSPIKSIRVKNFNCIGDIEMNFNDSPIIAICGDNDAGKSSFLDGFACLAYHANERNQKDNIRDGTQGFGIETRLEDGTAIIRTKTSKLNRFEVIYPDGHKWTTDKLEAGAGVPKPVQEVMGCIKEEETKEFLHIRTYRDQVLFINTTAGTNYKVMYGALKAQHISNAISKGTNELNKLKSIKNESDIILDTLMEQYNSIRVYDTEALVSIKNRINKHYKAIALLEEALNLKKRLMDIKEEQRKYKTLENKDLKDIDVTLVDKLLSAKQVYDTDRELQKQNKIYRPIHQCKELSIEALTQLNKVTQLKDELAEFKSKNRLYTQVNGCESLDVNLLLQLEQSIQDKHTLTELKQQALKFKGLENYKTSDTTALISMATMIEQLKLLKTQHQQLTQLEDRKQTLSKMIADSGVKMATCSHCGNMVYVE